MPQVQSCARSACVLASFLDSRTAVYRQCSNSHLAATRPRNIGQRQSIMARAGSSTRRRSSGTGASRRRRRSASSTAASRSERGSTVRFADGRVVSTAVVLGGGQPATRPALFLLANVRIYGYGRRHAARLMLLAVIHAQPVQSCRSLQTSPKFTKMEYNRCQAGEFLGVSADHEHSRKCYL